MNKKQWALVGLIHIFALGMLGGCGKSAASADAKDGQSVDKLTIVQIQDETNPDSGQKNEQFRSDMSEALGIEVEELEGADYSVGIEALKAGKLDVLLVSPMSYYQAKKIAGAEPLVTTTSMGQEEYKTLFVVGKDDTTTQSLADLKGKSFAFVDPASSSGYMYPKAKLVKELSLDPNQLENPGYFFDTVAYSGKHDSSLMGVAKGDYDAAAVAGQVITSLVDAGMIQEDDIRVIGETETIPNALFVVRSDLPAETKAALKEFYLTYENEEYFETFYGSKEVRFTEAKDEDYEVVQEMVEILNLEEE
ncbi:MULTISPECIES: phosphate/phosphite/phosphonate ABC transporter substrate-binding protein [unclassified Enterococcus]|uniref:phosphate/phosphite/phosphonate ABC transporter substrate-binding protein n=1 Tax=unclassified Enterococcus TaxID=2608891 RepID=UPI001908C6AA|nr:MULTISPECIES: phosphate/phosphite/phosphonate ABC transporter substrate-binding protein [unclassified Enterococcus]MBK0037304.1 phosphate/phosphite/phosphonate ABC transporter substrate-binding protein [Enterococcus sp. S52]MBK0069967.1 phosphate/phosphite/phosphonate ABC transporter substrate-binding protein [Enterococcus sp. S53]MBK0140807.1 phosphate/phosphite/phosphonate ABC transporter substrate-binding protein [Enterococcus sp. S76]MBK0144195.1 phosphate/phosphite/phosphonate ABC trans